MHADLGMMGQRVLDELGFMGREVIRDDVDLASEGLGGHDIGKKVDKLGAGMAFSGLATRCRCQLVRMPGGDRQNGARQPIIYFDRRRLCCTRLVRLLLKGISPRRRTVFPEAAGRIF